MYPCLVSAIPPFQNSPSVEACSPLFKRFISKGPSPNAISPSSPNEAPLLGLHAICSQDRYTLERRVRALAHNAYLGDNVTLCRILGRYKFYVASDDVGFGGHVILDGIWEPWVTTFMAKTVKPGMYVADVGANHGYYTVLMADIVGPEGRVLAVEPHPRTSDLLHRNVTINGFASHTDVADCAVGFFAGEILSLHVPDNEPKNAHVVHGSEAPGSLKIRSERLDDLLAGWPRIDFIKMDVEGAEEAALSGAAVTIERDRPQLLLEYNIHRCQNPEGLITWLTTLYGEIWTLDWNGNLEPVSRDALLDRDRIEDWMLYLTTKTADAT